MVSLDDFLCYQLGVCGCSYKHSYVSTIHEPHRIMPVNKHGLLSMAEIQQLHLQASPYRMQDASI